MKYVIPAVIILLALLGANGIYTVGEGHAAVLTRFGKVVDTDVGPGLHFKLPFAQEVTYYDTRTIVQQFEPEDYKTADGDAVRVGFFVHWQIADPGKWFEVTSGDQLRTTQLMAPGIRAALRARIAEHGLADLLAADGGEIDQALRTAVADEIRQQLGIAIETIGVGRVLPPEDTLASVYKRMSVQAKSRADAIRDKGESVAAAIRAKGDGASQQVVAAAAKQAAAVRGDGDAAATRIYAAASAKAPRFFRYWTALETWRKAFAGGGAVVLLDKNSSLMQAVDEGAVAGKH